MKHILLIEHVIVPVMILAAGVLVVQAHAIGYWQSLMGATVGLVASLGAELVGLYLVYQPGRLARGAGLLLMAVMVLVPAWVITGPQYHAWRETVKANEASSQRYAERLAGAQAQLPDLKADIAAQERSLRADEAKSAVRAGWLPELQRQRESLEAKRRERQRLDAIIAAPPPKVVAYDWWAAVPQLLPVLMLLIAFQLVDAYAVLRISGWRHDGVSVASPGIAGRLDGGETPEASRRSVSDSVSGNTPPTETVVPVETEAGVEAPFQSALGIETPRPAETSETPTWSEPHETPRPAETPETAAGNELLVKRLQRAIGDRIRQAGSARKFCAQSGLSPRDVSWLANHFSRVRAGQPTVSGTKLANFAARFLPEERTSAAELE